MRESTETGLSDRGKCAFFELVLRQFFDKADEDYVAARFLFLNGLYSQFPWVACQAIEKYLKAALLLRFTRVNREHELKSNFSKLSQCSGVSFPKMIEAPANFNFLSEQENSRGNLERWNYRMETSQFISRLDKMGSPNSRYNQTNINLEHYDIHRFDTVSKMFRDTALDGPQVLIHREVEDSPSDTKASVGLRFGRLRLTPQVSELIHQENYAYFPNYNSKIDRIHFLLRKNDVVKYSFGKNDPDYLCAEALLEALNPRITTKSE